jgi:SAM-dependent methyltransferase
MDEFNVIRYLEAKKTVDDRALNRQVMEALTAEVKARGETPLDVLEMGGGVGTMLARLLERGVLRRANYRLVDLDAAALARAAGYLEEWARRAGWEAAASPGGGLTLRQGDGACDVEIVRGDLYALAAAEGETCDLLAANAVLDLLDLGRAVPALMALLRPGGLFYFTINYDGETIFEPPVDAGLEEPILRLYNQSMDERVADGKPSGDSRTGRRLFAALRAAGAEVLAAGSSDWVVYPSRGRYTGDEAYFLLYILETIRRQLDGHPELDSKGLERWVAARRRQVEAGELVYIAHQLDFLGRR